MPSSATASHRARVAALAVTLVAAAAVAAAVLRRGDARDRPFRYEEPHRAVCDAASEARAGRLDGARRAFFDRAHDPLHALAGVAAARDRAAAARLLEAKEAAERALRSGAPAAAADLDRLAGAVSAAAVAAGDAAPRPCRQAA